jgi:hypothetical protein
LLILHLEKSRVLEFHLDFSPKIKPDAWKLSRALRNTQNLEKIERLDPNSQKSTQNLEELGFSDLPKTNR